MPSTVLVGGRLYNLQQALAIARPDTSTRIPVPSEILSFLWRNLEHIVAMVENEARQGRVYAFNNDEFALVNYYRVYAETNPHVTAAIQHYWNTNHRR